MKSFGEVIRQARLERKITLSSLEKITKIKKEYLHAIEKQRWDKLPDYPVLQGFVRLIGHSLDVDEKKLVAFLRRDYPPKQLRVSPKPDISDKVSWMPRVTIFLGGLVVMAVVIAYLVYQYYSFVSPPTLTVDFPPDGFVVKGKISLEVRGETTQDATVSVNNQPFIVNQDGSFSGTIGVGPETKELDIVAKSRAGKETEIKRSIKVGIDGSN